MMINIIRTLMNEVDSMQEQNCNVSSKEMERTKKQC